MVSSTVCSVAAVGAAVGAAVAAAADAGGGAAVGSGSGSVGGGDGGMVSGERLSSSTVAVVAVGGIASGRHTALRSMSISLILKA